MRLTDSNHKQPVTSSPITFHILEIIGVLSLLYEHSADECIPKIQTALYSLRALVDYDPALISAPDGTFNELRSRRQRPESSTDFGLILVAAYHAEENARRNGHSLPPFPPRFKKIWLDQRLKEWKLF